MRQRGQEQQLVLDSHYHALLDTADTQLPAMTGLELHDALGKAVPGFNLRLWPMEENGSECNWRRGLAHAHNLNTMNRLPAWLERSGTANTFQAWQKNLVWDQGRIHFTPDKIFFQPSYYVDRMFADEWLPLVVQADSTVPTLDVTAKKSSDGKVLTVYLVNLAETPVPVVFKVSGFNPAQAHVTQICSPNLPALNTPEQPETVISRLIPWAWQPENPRLELPGYSFTSIRLGAAGAPQATR